MIIPIVVMFGKKVANKFKCTSVIVIQVRSETRRNWSPTLSQDSRSRIRVPAAKDKSFGKNVLNLHGA